MSTKPIIYHIPVCPFCQRLEVLLALKGKPDAAGFEVVDITRPRDPALLEKTRGTTALPVLETPDGKILKESLVLLSYLDETVPGPAIRRADPYEHALEQMLIAMEGGFVAAGYIYVMNQDRAARDGLRDKLLEQYRKLDAFLLQHNPDGTFLFETFGLAESVYTPFFMRFWFCDYYEDFALPETENYARVRRWREACLAHPAAQQTSEEEIVKVYYDYSRGAGNGALPPGRAVSSFVFTPDWQSRPWPPRAKWQHAATDAELGLV